MKNRKPVYILTSLFIGSFAVIGLLAFLSNNKIEKKNGFNRYLLPYRAKVLNEITFPVNISRFLGMQKGKMYFQGISPYELICTDSGLNSFSTIKLSIPPNEDLTTGFRMFLHGRHLYLSCKSIPAITIYDLETATSFNHKLQNFYGKDAYISTDRFILRAMDPVSQSHRFIKLDLNRKDTFSEDHFSDRKIIGGFENDGMLYFDTTTKQACYSYYYQNGFICMDTNLNLQLKARTIDTVTRRAVKVTRVASSLTMKQPPQFVNLTGCVFAGKLYLQSMLKADNEYELSFNENSVVDIYSLKNGAYGGSFYIPAYKGKKTHQFQIVDQKLVALYGKRVVLYDVNFIKDL